MGRSAEEVAARRPPSSPNSACKRRPRPHRQGEEGGAGAIQSGKGRVLLPNHMNFRKGGGGSFSIQKLMLQILETLNRFFFYHEIDTI